MVCVVVPNHSEQHVRGNFVAASPCASHLAEGQNSTRRGLLSARKYAHRESSVVQSKTTKTKKNKKNSFTHQQARTLLFCARSEKTSVPLLHLWCRGWVGGSPLSLEPTGVKHYAREARLPRFTHQQARTLLFCARSEKTSVPLLHLWCTPPPSHPSLHQLGLSVTKRDTTRTEGG